MLQHTYYTAVGHYLCKTDEAGRTYPVVICHQKEYSVDLQEMTLWTALNWRLLDRRQAEQQYQKLARDLIPTPPRSFDDCLSRLCLRGSRPRGRERQEWTRSTICSVTSISCPSPEASPAV